MAMPDPLKGAVGRLYSSSGRAARMATPSPLKGAVGRLYRLGRWYSGYSAPDPLKGAVGRLYSVASRGLLFERRRARHPLKEDVHVA
jgi:hypothetical protein